MSMFNQFIHSLCHRFELDYEEVKQFVVDEYHSVQSIVDHVEHEISEFITGGDEEDEEEQVQ